jgi:hypothetical protein
VKALVLTRVDAEEEATKLCNEVLAAKPNDETILTFVTDALVVMRQREHFTFLCEK